MEYLNIVFQEVYKILFLLVPVLVSVAMIVWLDRRVWAFVQKRQGPNVVGPFGLLQSLADALKYIFKEIIIPSSSNKVIFILAPIVTMTLALISWAVIPFSATQVLADINVGILYLFAVSSLGVYGIIMGGWASNSKYPFLGAIRSAAQMVSYEVSIGVIIIDDLLCVGATENIMLSSTIGRNKGLITGEVLSAIIGGTESLLEEYRKHGIDIISTGGETADVGDLVRTIIVDSTVVARMTRADVIDNANIKAGNVIVGMASFGQSTYESEYNGGMGSNGLTSARHEVFGKELAAKYPESFDPAVPESLVYTGAKTLTEATETSLDAGKLVLSPTRTYAPIIKQVLEQYRDKIDGMVHCSGGAQTKILHFLEKGHVIKDALFPIPPLFKMIQEQSGTSWEEMYQVFNCGHRMEIYTSPEVAEDIIKISKSYQVDAKIIGRVEASDVKKLTIKSDYGVFEY